MSCRNTSESEQKPESMPGVWRPSPGRCIGGTVEKYLKVNDTDGNGQWAVILREAGDCQEPALAIRHLVQLTGRNLVCQFAAVQPRIGERIHIDCIDLCKCCGELNYLVTLGEEREGEPEWWECLENLEEVQMEPEHGKES